MPDWFYRTVSQRLLFRLPLETGRRIALGTIGRLARLPGGLFAIDFLGHMRPAKTLRVDKAGLTFQTPIGLTHRLDPTGTTARAFSQFGVGFQCWGPLRRERLAYRPPVRDDTRKTIAWPTAALGCTPEQALSAWKSLPSEESRRAIFLRIDFANVGSAHLIANELAELRPAIEDRLLFLLDLLPNAVSRNWTSEDWRIALAGLSPSDRAMIVLKTADVSENILEQILLASETQAIGVFVDGGTSLPDGSWSTGQGDCNAVTRTLLTLREKLGDALLLIAAGGVHEPATAREFLSSGADLVAIDTGLVYRGPGLIKRCNDLPAALLSEPTPINGDSIERESDSRPARFAWFWLLLLGMGMFGGGIAAIIIAATRVVLHYDEEFVGLTRAQLLEVNSRLLSFMTHDRVTLAGTMCALGLTYMSLAWFGVRRGRDWARRTILYSAFTGFAGFFLFLGFGYLDPFHAFVTVVLLQLLLMSMPARLILPAPRMIPPDREDWRWRWLQWGQFILILHACALFVAGATISTIGCTTVLIPHDLHYLRTTHQTLNAAGAKIIPLIAHDRATFGAMLLSNAWAFLLPTLWGVAYGERWLWWTTLIAGCCGYVPALIVHFHVGYTDFVHLLPAYAGWTMLMLGLGFCFPYYSTMCEPKSRAD